jgi:hypothetical protein
MLLKPLAELQLLSIMLLGLGASLATAGTREKQHVLQLCVREFGSAVDTKQNLFSVNDAFVLQLTFNRKNLLRELTVKPKYFFNETHPEWEEPPSFPLLKVADFKTLLRRVDTLKAKGRLVKPSNGLSVITNSTAYYQDLYRRALVKWGEVGSRGNSYNGIRFFSVQYFPAHHNKSLHASRMSGLLIDNWRVSQLRAAA